MMTDVMLNIDPKQYMGKKMTGTEHMVVALMDIVLSLLDNNNTRSAVIILWQLLTGLPRLTGVTQQRQPQN